MPITVEQVKKVVGNHPAGISIDLKTGQVLTGTGFCVASHETQDQHDDGGLLFSFTHAMGTKGAGIIGAWSYNGVVYYDSVKQYSTRVAAVQAAQKEKQIAIYNLNTGMVEDIMTPDGTNPSFIPSLATGRKRAHSI